MTEPNREQLLDYLIGALSERERAELERHLAADPRWQAALGSLAESMQPLLIARDVELEPPAGLADRACDLVARLRDVARAAPASVRLERQMAEPLVSRKRWTLADAVVCAGICFVATALFFPAILHSRTIARLTACQNNLRNLGMSLIDYSETAGAGYFPAVPSAGKRAVAGIYAPLLVESGCLVDHLSVLCPSAAAEQVDWRVPTTGEIDAAEGPVLARLQTLAGGSYGYSLGVLVGGEHRPPRNRGRAYFALMSDAPPPTLSGLHLTGHNRCGVNLLYEDGHVRFVVGECRDEVAADHPFQNRLERVEAGLDEDDAVIAASSTPPFATPVHLPQE